MEDWESSLLDDSKPQSVEEQVGLLEKLLDSDSTLFSSKIRDWLLKKGRPQPLVLLRKCISGRKLFSWAALTMYALPRGPNQESFCAHSSVYS